MTDFPDMHSLLGVHQLPVRQAGEYLLAQALEHLQKGNAGQARKLCEEMLAQNKDEPGALQLAGIIALQEKNYGQAIEYLAQALKVQPNNLSACFNLGQVLLLTKQYAQAEKVFVRVLQLAPDMVSAQLGLGQALGYLGRYEAALQNLELAIAQIDKLSVSDAGLAWMYKGMAQGSLAQTQASVTSFEQAINLDSNLVQAHYGMGNAMLLLGKLDEAERHLKQAVVVDANFVPAHFLLGVLLSQHQQYADALQCFDRTIELAPKFVNAYYGRGLVWQSLGEHGKAGRSFSDGLKIDPDHVLCLHGMGNALVEANQYEYALNAFRRADELQPGSDYVAGMLVFLARQLCLWEHDATDVAALHQRLLAGEYAVEPFAVLSLFDEPALHAKAALMHMRKYHPQAYKPPRQQSRKAKDKIHIAYVLSDIDSHATACLIAGLLEQHDRDRFKVYVLSYGPDSDDAMRVRIKHASDKFVDISRMSDAVVAEFCRHQKVDIAIDLKGITRNSRPGIFAQRAAPVQVSYLGYPGTMAAPCYDYMIADSVVIAPEQRQHYSEAIVYMPHSYQVNDQQRGIDAALQKRAAHGLPGKGVVFCCFNNYYKITPEVFACWMRIMTQVPGSVLWLLHSHEAAHRHLREAAEKHGVAAERLIFAPKLDLPQHLARHRLAHLSLDTLPCNAHAAASDALWAGLPHITCMGQSFASRVSASLLMAVGLPELITHNLMDYEALAVELALHPARLQKLKRKLVNQIETAPLFDAALFARHIESAYVNMHQRWLAGEKPVDIRVDK